MMNSRENTLLDTLFHVVWACLRGRKAIVCVLKHIRIELWFELARSIALRVKNTCTRAQKWAPYKNNGDVPWQIVAPVASMRPGGQPGAIQHLGRVTEHHAGKVCEYQGARPIDTLTMNTCSAVDEFCDGRRVPGTTTFESLVRENGRIFLSKRVRLVTYAQTSPTSHKYFKFSTFKFFVN